LEWGEVEVVGEKGRMFLHLWFREEEVDCFEPRKEGFFVFEPGKEGLKDLQDLVNPYILFFLVQDNIMLKKRTRIAAGSYV